MFVAGARHLRIVGAAKVAKVRASLPLGGGGVGGEGDGGWGSHGIALCHAPPLPKPLPRGERGHTRLRLSTLLHQALVQQLNPVLHDKRCPALQMRHATDVGRRDLRGCASGQ